MTCGNNRNLEECTPQDILKGISDSLPHIHCKKILVNRDWSKLIKVNIKMVTDLYLSHQSSLKFVTKPKKKKEVDQS